MNLILDLTYFIHISSGSEMFAPCPVVFILYILFHNMFICIWQELIDIYYSCVDICSIASSPIWKTPTLAIVLSLTIFHFLQLAYPFFRGVHMAPGYLICIEIGCTFL